jgi:ABC-type multidrug transport system fused ATPase/permease subunit
MSEPKQPKKRNKHQHFWRACRFLLPYRNRIVISVVAALGVGLALAGGLTAMIPIMQVLINGDTVQGWIYRQTAAARMGVTFSQEPNIVRIVQVNGDLAKAAGFTGGQIIVDADFPAGASDSPFNITRESFQDKKNIRPAYLAGEIYRHIALADGAAVARDDRGRSLQSENIVIMKGENMPESQRQITLLLPPVKWYNRWGLEIVRKIPLDPVRAVAVIFSVMALLAIGGQVLRFFQEHESDQAAIYTVNDIRRRLYDKVLRIPISSFGQQGSSDATSRLVSDTDTLQDGFKTVLGQSIQEPIKAAMAFGVALWYSWQLTLFIIIFAPVMATMMRKFGKKMRRASRAALRSSSTMLGQIEATLSGIRVVKAFNAQRFERQRYMKIMNALIGEQVKMSRIDTMSGPIMESFIMVMAGFVVLFATYKILVSRTITSTGFLFVMISLATIAESLRKASKVNNALQKSNAAAQRIFEILDLESEVEVTRALSPDNVKTAPLKLPPLARSISFENLVFMYPGTTAPALQNVSLAVPRGQSIAIVGRNGSGKTTLLALLERFYDPQAGRILIDGIDIRNVTLKSLREQISYVTQDSVIFPATIAENIAYGEPLASPDSPDSPEKAAVYARIQDAASRAFAHDFIIEKPGGYNMMLGGLGGQLSGGQKQRVCIARAIFHQSPILVLDEATSQVDAESEHLIQQAIEHLMHERTTFVIAHRFSTILSADTIVVMERGQIVGQGKHKELLETCEVYQQLYERQLGR